MNDKAKQKEYDQRPEVKAKKKKYYQRPEVHTRRLEQKRKRDLRPEVKAKLKKYHQKPYDDIIQHIRKEHGFSESYIKDSLKTNSNSYLHAFEKIK